MKKSSAILAALLALLFLPSETNGGCPPRTRTVSGKKRTACSSSVTRRNSSSFKRRKLDALQKNERFYLSEIHRLQTRLFLRRDKLSAKQKAQYGEQLQKRIDDFKKTAYGLRDFPFENKMADIGPVVLDIQSGKINFEKCAGKKEAYILRKIHQAQFKSLSRSYNYRELD